MPSQPWQLMSYKYQGEKGFTYEKSIEVCINQMTYFDCPTGDCAADRG